MKEDDNFDYDIDGDEVPMDSVCPYCHEEYDEIDYEYQICHLCGFENLK